MKRNPERKDVLRRLWQGWASQSPNPHEVLTSEYRTVNRVNGEIVEQRFIYKFTLN